MQVPTLVVSTLLSSLLGSLHCVGMCGGISAFYEYRDTTSRARRWVAPVAYHGMRAGAYVLLGALAGGLGSQLDAAGARLGVAAVAAPVAAGWLALLAAGALLHRGPSGQPQHSSLARLRPRPRAPRRRWGEVFLRPLRSLARRAHDQPPAIRAAAVGLCSVLLPCGWLYAFVLSAAGTGSSASGAWLMLAFWLGSVPGLVGASLVLRKLWPKLRQKAPQLSALALLSLGILTVAVRWPAFASDRSGGQASPGCHDLSH